MKRKKNKNKKGFTMIEMLAVFIIIGVLSSIGVISYLNFQKQQEAKFDASQLQIFKQTGKNFFGDKKNRLPSIYGNKERVYLEDLIKENYLDELLDYHKKSYNVVDSYVEVRRLASNFYSYTAVLYKDGEDVKPIEEKDPHKGIIVVNNYSKTNNDSSANALKKISCKKNGTKVVNCTGKENSDVYYSNGDLTTINLTATDSDGIYLYRYYIYKNNKVVKMSDYIEVSDKDRKKFTDNINLYKTDYGDGTYKVKLIIYDSLGFSSSMTSKDMVLDFTKPACKPIKTPATTWSKDTVTVSGNCTDSSSGCVVDSISAITKLYKNEMKNNVNVGTVYDYAGNINSCGTIDVNIDKTPPTCHVLGESTSYIKGTRTISTKCTDNGNIQSGCVSGEIKHNYSKTAATDTLNEIVKDAAGNTTTCKKNVNVYVDNTAPTCKSSGGSPDWRTSAFYIKGTCSDDNSKCRGDVQLLISTEQNTTNLSPGTVCDNVGNCTRCPANQTARLDLNAPNITCSASMSNGSTGVDGYNIWVYATDSMSEMKSYTRNPVNNLKSSQTYTVYDNAGRSASCRVNISSYNETRHRTRTSRLGSPYVCDKQTIYGKWFKSCSKYTSGIHGEYEYKQNTDYDSGHGAACTGGLNAVYMRKVTVKNIYCQDELPWGSWSGWSTAGCANSDTNNCEYRKNYSASISY